MQYFLHTLRALVIFLRHMCIVQNQAAKFVTGNYNYETGSITGILEHLKWESLKKRRRGSRLLMVKDSIPTHDKVQNKTQHHVDLKNPSC